MSGNDVKALLDINPSDFLDNLFDRYAPESGSLQHRVGKRLFAASKCSSVRPHWIQISICSEIS